MFNILTVLSKKLIPLSAYIELFSKQQFAASSSKMSKTTLGVEPCTHLVWMDLEMTGLDEKVDKLLEVSCLVTDKDLNILAEGPCLVIKQPKEILDNMNEWCIHHHNKSGLVEKVLQSDITTEQADAAILKFLKENVPYKQCPLSGNSVYMDRIFLRMHMPAVDDYLHYRIVDVSTIKELCRRWNRKIYQAVPKKKLTHRSLDDIKESIEELKYYQKNFLKEAI